MFPVGEEAVKQSFGILESTITTLQVLKDLMTKHCDAKHYSLQINESNEKICIS